MIRPPPVESYGCITAGFSRYSTNKCAKIVLDAFPRGGGAGGLFRLRLARLGEHSRSSSPISSMAASFIAVPPIEFFKLTVELRLLLIHRGAWIDADRAPILDKIDSDALFFGDFG